MSSNIGMGELSAIIGKELNLFDSAVKEKVKRAARKATRQAVEELKQTSPKRTGEYAESWTSAATNETKAETTYTVYAAAPKYRITHLLENGHINKKTGKRTAPIPHISTAEENAIENFMQELEGISDGL